MRLLTVGLVLALGTGLATASPVLESSTVDLRLRHESARQDNGLATGRATTLRSRLGVSSIAWQGLSGFVEYESVAALDRDGYNSGPGGNGQTGRSVVADPTGSELNQAYLQFRSRGLTARAGRQRLIHDNARFIGNVGWRQNEQTFDAISLALSPPGAVRLEYAYLDKVNTIFFGHRRLDGHLARLGAPLVGGLDLGAYAYWLDFAQGQDSRTTGLMLSGRRELGAVTASLRLEAARQGGHADSRGDPDRDYRLGRIGLTAGAWSLALAQEILGSHRGSSFSTPLATLHRFNGWADVFLVTPAAGLVDRSLQIGWASGRWRLNAVHHDFRPDQGAGRFGRETDFAAAYRWGERQQLLLKLADYLAADFGSDTRKWMLQWELKL